MINIFTTKSNAHWYTVAVELKPVVKGAMRKNGMPGPFMRSIVLSESQRGLTAKVPSSF
jgi:hypothetical protein